MAIRTLEKEKKNEINITKIDVMRKEEEKRKELERRTFKYIGETSRSAYERGGEHLRDLNDHDPGSHLLKHVIKYHMDDPDNVEFRMKVLTSHFTAFNRQITEAVKIKRNEGIFLMNSKSEYNRSLLPSIRTNDSKTPWEKSDLSEEEVKEGLRALRRNGSKMKWSLKLCENENGSLVDSLFGENAKGSLTGSIDSESKTHAGFDHNEPYENVDEGLIVPRQAENEKPLEKIPEYQNEGLVLPLHEENVVSTKLELNKLPYVERLSSVKVSQSQYGIRNVTNVLGIDGSAVGIFPTRIEEKSPENVPNDSNETIKNLEANELDTEIPTYEVKNGYPKHKNISVFECDPPKTNIDRKLNNEFKNDDITHESSHKLNSLLGSSVFDTMDRYQEKNAKSEVKPIELDDDEKKKEIDEKKEEQDTLDVKEEKEVIEKEKVTGKKKERICGILIKERIKMLKQTKIRKKVVDEERKEKDKERKVETEIEMKNKEAGSDKEDSRKKEINAQNEKKNMVERKNPEQKEKRGRKRATQRKLYKGEQTIDRFLVKKEDKETGTPGRKRKMEDIEETEDIVSIERKKKKKEENVKKESLILMKETPPKEEKEDSSKEKVRKEDKEEGERKKYKDSRMNGNILEHQGRERKGSLESFENERKSLPQKYFLSPSLKNVRISGKIRVFEGQIKAKSAENTEKMHDLLVEGTQAECKPIYDSVSVSTNEKQDN